MPDFVRRIVSGPKARYIDPKLGVDLDLVYVTDRLIIMGWPASSFEALYRNSRRDVRKFLEARHEDKYRIYNLCPCTENNYDADEFYGSVSRYPFPDHHPPPLSMIPMFVADITAWFAEDPSNVAVIHCKAGKGRSGTMACSYLLSLPSLPPPPQSLRNCGNKHDREVLEEHRRAKNAAKAGASSIWQSNATTPDVFATPHSFLTAQPELNLQIPSEPSFFPAGVVASPARINVELRQDRPSNKNADEEKLDELKRRLNAVFEFHTSRRLKPAKSSASSATSSPLRSRTSSFNLTQIDDNAGAAMQDGHSKGGMRPRKSISNMMRSFSRSNAASPSKGNEVTASPEGRNGKEPHVNSKSTTDLCALGASPAGRSRNNLGLSSTLLPLQRGTNGLASQQHDPWSSSLSITSFATVDVGSSSPARRGSLPLLSSSHLDVAGSTTSGNKLRQTQSPDQLAVKSMTAPPSRHSGEMSSMRSSQGVNIISPPLFAMTGEYSGEMQAEDDGPDQASLPRLAVSIPSQRRWVGYWARMLAGLDPRAALDSNLMHPSRRQVRLLRIFVDRKSVSKSGEEMEGSLSVQISRYNDRLAERLETWERTARRRNRAFGALDPSAPSPHLPASDVPQKKEGEKREEDSDQRGGDEDDGGEMDSSRSRSGPVKDGGASAQEKAQIEEDDNRRWRDCERRNLNHKEEYDRKLRQHGNDTGVGQWGVNVMAEKENVRNFCWDDDKDGPAQVETVALVSEESRRTLSSSKAAFMLSKVEVDEKKEGKSYANNAIIRYSFEPGKDDATHLGGPPLPTWTKPSGAKDTLSKLFRQHKSRPALVGSDQSQSNSSSETSQSKSTTTTMLNETSSPATSDDSLADGNGERGEGGLMLDADREVQLRVLVGRSGSTHSRLPDVLSAGYVWLIPAFETPLLDGDKKPRKGQRVQCQFGTGEIDFRKGKKAAPLMGGGDIRSIAVEFEWVEVGWHEADEEEDEEEDETLQ